MTSQNCIAVVDDEAAIRFTLDELLSEVGYRVRCFANATEALAALNEVDVLVSDMRMPGMSGLELVAELKQRRPQLPVILLTAHGGERLAVAAIKAGAYDYLSKPFDIDELLATLERACELSLVRTRARRLEAERQLGTPVIGDSSEFQALLDSVARLADRELSVLVQGETGTGKELIAGLLHTQGRRAQKPLVRFNCASIPAELAESQLFGHRRGAFTGAERDHRGFFEQADGGTLVLDEIAELPSAVQAKLLRVLQEGQIQPLGGETLLDVDVRVVACTHRDLSVEVAAGRFRQDLLYRLDVVRLRVPPLRERGRDILALARSFAAKHGQEFGEPARAFSTEEEAALLAHAWPGNVRELENCIARWLALGGELRPGGALSTTDKAHGEQPLVVAEQGLRQRMADFERSVLKQTLADCEGNQSEAARRLKISRVTLIDKLKRHGLFVRRIPAGR